MRTHHCPQLLWHVMHTLPLQALEVDPNNTKAMYRRAQAYMGQGDNVEAEQDVKRALLLAPQDVDLLNLQKRLRVVLREEAQKQKAIYSKMFSKPLVRDEPAKPSADAKPATDDSGMMESDTLPPGTEPTPNGSVLLEEA